MSLNSALSSGRMRPGIRFGAAPRLAPVAGASAMQRSWLNEFRGVKGEPFDQCFDLRIVPHKLGEPLRWKVAQDDICELHELTCSMTCVPSDYIEAVAQVMAKANWHTYQVLTKRSQRMGKTFRPVACDLPLAAASYLVGRKCGEQEARNS